MRASLPSGRREVTEVWHVNIEVRHAKIEVWHVKLEVWHVCACHKEGIARLSKWYQMGCWDCEVSTTACGRAMHMTTDDETTLLQRMMRIPREFEEFDKVAAHILAHTDAIKQQGSSRNSSKFVIVIIQILITPEHV